MKPETRSAIFCEKCGLRNFRCQCQKIQAKKEK
jgi:hypothetical protein